jgi:NAD+ synthase (glutamine-hydrolysing)
MPPAWALQSAETAVFSSQGLAICAARLFAVSVLRYGFRPSKMAFLSPHAWSDPDRGDWPPRLPARQAAGGLAEGDSALARCFREAVQRSAMPNGPKVSHGGSLSPRGDWRAPSNISPKTWLDEIEREIPEG